MKAAISILIVLGVILGVWKMFDYWDRVNQQREAQERAAERKQNIDPRQLAGLDRELEPSLEAAYHGGARGLKNWLNENKRTGKCKDPRLGWIELDYVVKATDDPRDAKKVFAEVKQRTPADSPIYSRIKQLEKTYD